MNAVGIMKSVGITAVVSSETTVLCMRMIASVMRILDDTYMHVFA